MYVSLNMWKTGILVMNSVKDRFVKDIESQRASYCYNECMSSCGGCATYSCVWSWVSVIFLWRSQLLLYLVITGERKSLRFFIFFIFFF